MNTSSSYIEPFEIATIRPPTENQSLAFRLTRNCYWNKCAFCPAYKFGLRFSKRSLEEVLEDVRRAAEISRILDTAERTGADGSGGLRALYRNALEMIKHINAGKPPEKKEARPESKADPSVLQDPVLSWFLQWVQQEPSIEDSLEHLIFWRMEGKKTCFLGDADAMIIKPDFMDAVLAEIRKNFPSIERYTVYGRTAAAARTRSLRDLERFRISGLDRVHYGIESGSDKVLEFVKKGASRADHVEGCLKTKQAGLSCSVYVMPGLGGRELSEEHAAETASVLSDIQPDYIRLRSLEIFPQTPLAEARDRGEFTEADEDRVVREIRIMVEEINCRAVLLSDSASNLLDVNGRLPEDRGRMLERIDGYLNMPEKQRRIFSLKSRLRAFEGQYGGLTRELYKQLQPYIKGGDLDLSGITPEEAVHLTRQIRSRLMP